MQKILVIGAGGGVASVLVGRLLAANVDAEFTLADLHPERVSADTAGARARVVPLDLFNAAALENTIRGHDLVLHCAGPFARTAEPVARACIAAGANCLDLSDDIEAVEAVLPLHHDAEKAGVALLMGAGVSPGLTNVLAADLRRKFDTIACMDVAWLSGDEGGDVPGRAVLEHVLHIAGHNGTRWRNGALETFRSYTIPSTFPMGGAMGDRVLFEVAHPEPLMLGRSFTDAPVIRCFGGIDPPAVGAVVRGVARAVYDNKLSMDDAIEFLQGASEGKLRAPGAWGHAVGGIIGGLLERMISPRDVATFAAYLAGSHQTFAGGVLCRISGTCEGRDTTMVLRSCKSGPGTFVDSMANGTGTCGAAFTLLMLDNTLSPGVRFPENTDPDAVYAAFNRLGFPTGDMLECVEN